MNAWPKLYPWATDWIQRFQDPAFQWSNLKPEDMDPKDLGFLYRPEYAVKFREAYGAAADNPAVLEEKLNFIHEEPYLASRLYDRWLQLWNNYPEHHPDENDRAWFLLAFQRLALLGSENRLTFQGTPKELWLTSSMGPFFSRPDPGQEFEQRIFLTSTGQVRFWAYCVSASHCPGRQILFSIHPDKAHHILSEAVRYCTQELEPSPLAFDGGEWSMELTNEKNQAFRFSSYLVDSPEEKRFSNLLRSALGMSDLLAMDGKRRTFPKLQRLILDCTETIPVPVIDREEEDIPKYSIYHEKLTLDRISGTLERTLGDTGYHRYLFPEQVCRILDFVSDPLFFQVHDIPEDMLAPQSNCSTYTLTLEWADGSEKILSGRYDQWGLPERFPELMNRVDILLRPPYFRPLSSSFYRRKPHLKTDLIYCSVEFANGWNTYYYRTDDYSLEEGDDVVVPAGKDNHLAIVTIREIEYYSPEDVPFPFEKTKMILRRCTAEDYAEIGWD